MARDRLVQLGRVARRGGDLDAVVAQQRRHAVAHERRVVGDHDAQRAPAALAPAHLVDHHATGEARQAHLAILPEAQVRVLGDQLPDERGGQYLSRARESRQSRSLLDRCGLGAIGGADLSGVHSERELGRRRLRLLDRHRAANRLAGAPERERRAARRLADLDPAVALHQFGPGT